MKEHSRSPDPTDPDSLLAMLPDPEPLGSETARRPASEHRLAEVEATVRLLSETVSQLAATVGRITDDDRTSPASDASTAPGSASPDELVDWVCWLIDTYNLGHTIPRCWADHPRLVEELDALRLGWLGTVAAGRPGLDSLVWHDHLRRFLKTAAGYDRQCTRGHQAPQAPPASDTHRPQGAHVNLRADRYQPGASPPSGNTP